MEKNVHLIFGFILLVIIGFLVFDIVFNLVNTNPSCSPSIKHYKNIQTGVCESVSTCGDVPANYIIDSTNCGVNADCKMRCNDNRPIPCVLNSDCDSYAMSKTFCDQNEIIFRNGFSSFCEEGYCQAYGCGQAPSVD